MQINKINTIANNNIQKRLGVSSKSFGFSNKTEKAREQISVKNTQEIYSTNISAINFPTLITIDFPEKNYIDIFNERPQKNIFGEEIKPEPFINPVKSESPEEILQNTLDKFQHIDAVKLKIRNKDKSYVNIILSSQPDKKIRFYVEEIYIKNSITFPTKSNRPEIFKKLIKSQLSNIGDSEFVGFSITGTEKAFYKKINN